jgi:hypothetical protein
MLQVQRAVLRPRLRRAWLAVLLVSCALAAGVAGRVAFTPDVAPSRRPTCLVEDNRVDLARREVRQLSLEVCLARHEVERSMLRERCAAGTASKKECSPGEGQYRMDPCARYRPPDPVPVPRQLRRVRGASSRAS